MDEIIWRGMNRPQLDAAYNNTAAVANSAAKIAEWTERSARLRAQKGELLDLAYGPRPRNRIDIFKCGAERAPLFAFIHGGYWQSRSKEIFSCMAEGPLARGMDAALIGYTLAPEATLTEIVEEVRAAMRWLRAEGPRSGIAENGVIASGWSAGGHLTAMVLPEADAGLAISGIFELTPCRLNYLNEKLHLTADEVVKLSPIRHPGKRSKPLTIAFGEAELPELQRQSRDYYAARQKAGPAARLLPLRGHDHFSILEELANPAGRLTEAAVKLA
ncbi:MAG TPA: alpha/beta hydrolase [Xanthobacteraceae bacterium]|nr:alpha/beta hydrolase [Xanthobacteraceae bacterium]